MFLTLKHETKEQHIADVIVYGLGFQAVAEVAKATNNALNKSVIVICNTAYLNYVGLPQSENKIIRVRKDGITFFGIALNYIANLLLPGYVAGVSSFACGVNKSIP